MLTFTELRDLFAESIFLMYCGYFMPLLLFLLTKHVWKFLTKSNRNTIEHRKAVIDIGGGQTQIQTQPQAHIQTDSNKIASDNNKCEGDDDDNGDEYKPHLPEREHIQYRGITEFLDKSGEKFYKLANDRRSIRKFAKDKAVDDCVIEKCILAAGKLLEKYTIMLEYVQTVNKIYDDRFFELFFLLMNRDFTKWSTYRAMDILCD